MMRKFRYELVKPVTPFKRFATVAYFLIGWNCMGLVIYSLWRRKQKEKDPEFDKLTSKAKYMQMIGWRGDSFKEIKVSGLSVVKQKDVKFEELAQEKR